MSDLTLLENGAEALRVARDHRQGDVALRQFLSKNVPMWDGFALEHAAAHLLYLAFGLDAWHKFEDDAAEKALRQWCEENRIELVD